MVESSTLIGMAGRAGLLPSRIAMDTAGQHADVRRLFCVGFDHLAAIPVDASKKEPLRLLAESLLVREV